MQPYSPGIEESLALLDVLSQHGPCGFAYVDRSYRFLHVNETLARISNRPVAEHLGRLVPEVVGASGWQWMEPICQNVLAGREAVDIDLSGPRHNAPDNMVDERIHMLASFYPVRVGREITGIAMIVRDMTHQTAAEQSREQSEIRFRTLFDTSRDAISVSTQGRFVYVNPAYVAMYGFARAEDLINTSSIDRVVPADRAALMERIRYAASGNKDADEGVYEVRALRADNTIFDAEHRVTQYLWNSVPHMLDIQRDITERKRMEQALHESEQRLRLAIDAAEIGVWDWDIQGNTLNWSSKCRTLFGIPQEGEMNYNLFLQALHPDDRDRAHHAVMDALLNHTECDVEVRVVWPDESLHWVVTRGNGYYDENGAGVRMEGLAFDVTDRRKSVEQEQERIAWQRRFLKEMLASVTDGKLNLCDTREELPDSLPIYQGDLVLDRDNGLRTLRRTVTRATEEAGFELNRTHDFEVAVGEAGMNAVIHAGSGVARVCSDNANRVQVWVEDKGKGISVENLPRATLEKGFTTAGTSGVGMKMMMKTADRIYLLTGTGGTTVVLEQDKTPPAPDWLKNHA